MKPAVDSLPAPTCPKCGAELTLGSKDQLDFWSCPAGHGLGFTLSEAYERLQNDEIAKIWHDSQNARAGKYACPMCGVTMANLTVGVDAKSDSTQVSIDVCREDELFWFDAGELGDRVGVERVATGPAFELGACAPTRFFHRAA